LTSGFFKGNCLNSYISKTQYGDLIYSNDHSNQLQPWLASKGDGRFRLKIAINKLKQSSLFSE
jgi:hypothetical protein